ncbi:MAG: ABC transporter permease [Opitutales bacterium]|nr:ABC transporter permease [Opitutales bacterium]
MRRIFTEFAENARIAAEQIGAHKMRSLLTALGVIIGVMAVTLMGTAVNGLDKGFSDSLDMLGTDLLYVERWPWGGAGDDWMRYRNRPTLRTEYARLLNEIILDTPNSALEAAVPCALSFRAIQHGGESVSNVYIVGTTAAYGYVNRADIEFGRFFNDAEYVSGRNVIILGYDVAEALFETGRETAIGQEVRIRGLRYEVIGVFRRQGSFLGLQSFDNQAAMPLSALRRFERGNWHTHVRVKMRPDASLHEARSELEGAMRRIRGLLPGQENDFEINQTEMLEDTIGNVKTQIAIGGFFITGLALFVGAIGIMNITFVSVRERTREIGTRRALGARRGTILAQFLMEAVGICLIGGAVGLALTVALKFVFEAIVPAFPFILSPQLIVAAVVVSIATGIFSGFVPAFQASRLDPAEALRHE